MTSAQLRQCLISGAITHGDAVPDAGYLVNARESVDCARALLPPFNGIIDTECVAQVDIDTVLRRAYYVSPCAGGVIVVDIAHGQILSTIPLNPGFGWNLSGIAVDSISHRVYVAAQFFPEVYVIDGAGMSWVDTILCLGYTPPASRSTTI